METLRKHRRGAPPGFFRVEAAGLAWLADAGAVRVARVLTVDDGYIGDAPLPLRTEATWGTFYARHRIRPYLHAARHPVFEALCDRLKAGDFDDAAPPARIHGDLWSGNLLWTPTGAALIDPAAHGGHRITDLAMLALFGAPQLGRVLAAYAEASEHLPDRWRDLVPLHQVHPLLVHAVLFGGGYVAQAERAASEALSLP